MTRDEILKLAREAGIGVTDESLVPVWHLSIKNLEGFAHLVAAVEREACANLCDRMPDLEDGWRANLPSDCAAAIRARRNT